MIQRIQSLFIFLAAAFLGVMFFFPIVNFDMRWHEGPLSMYANGFQGADSLYNTVAGAFWFPVFMAVIALTVALLLTALFSYKHRPRQIKLCIAAFMLDFALITLLFFIPDTMAAHLEPGLPRKEAARMVHYSWGALLPILSLAGIHFATRYIRKDEELVRSADRLR